MRHIAAALLVTLALLAACTPFPLTRDDASRTWELNPEPPLGLATRIDATLHVARPTAIPALATSAMAYRESAYQRRYYARNRWVDEPARLLHSQLVDTVERAGLFTTVLPDSGGQPADFRLESELLELDHDYRERESGRARVILRARLVDVAAGTVIATQRFAAEADSTEAGPEGGVAATNRALESVLEELMDWLGSNVE